MVGALTLGISLSFKRRKLDRRDPKRRRTLADFVDALVSLAPHPDIYRVDDIALIGNSYRIIIGNQQLHACAAL